MICESFIATELRENNAQSASYFNSYIPNFCQDTFYGVGRTSLARGELGEDYQGHVFWDSEMYTIPYAILFQPEMVKRILRYRSYIAPAAKNYASRTGIN